MTVPSLHSLAMSAGDWLVVHGWRFLAIALIAAIAQKVSGAVIAHAVRSVVRASRGDQKAEKQREDTLIQVLGGGATVIIWVCAFMMALSEAGIEIGPLLAAAGIAGIAVGFGGQYLIRDLITGMFILLENQYRTGDVVCFDSICGSVESISLRKTTLRDLDGTVHHIPHGDITRVSNLTSGFARVNLDVRVPYTEDLERVIEVINATGKELAEDPKWKPDIRSAPQFLRVNDFGESAIIIKILGDTEPIRQWDVTAELRKRIKIAFDRAGIVMPLPQRVVHTQQ